ncbi:DUF4296 domain-containing protein [Myroides sp. LJL115]
MKRVVLFLLVMVFVGCKQAAKKPENLIEKNKFEEILYDISLFYSVKGLNSYSKDSNDRLDLQSVLKRHGLDSLTFTQSNRYYIGLHDGTYKQMQSNVLKRIEKQKAIVDSLYNLSLNQQTQLDTAPVLDSIEKPRK